MENKDINNQIVYFFRQKGTDFVKIGMTSSNDCSSRFSAFSMYSPTGSEIDGLIKCSDARSLEISIHKELKEKRIKGEFFLLTKNESLAIINRHSKVDVSEIMTIILSYVGSDSSRLDKVKSIIQKGLTNNIDINHQKEAVLRAVYDKYEKIDFWTYKITSTDVLNSIKENLHELNMNPEKIGRILSTEFKKRRVRRGNNVITCYNLKPKL